MEGGAAHSLTQALLPDFKGIFRCKQCFGKANKYFCPGKKSGSMSHRRALLPSLRGKLCKLYSPAHFVLFLLVSKVFQQHSHPVVGPSVPGGPRFRTQRFVPGVKREARRSNTVKKGKAGCSMKHLFYNILTQFASFKLPQQTLETGEWRGERRERPLGEQPNETKYSCISTISISASGSSCFF